MLHSADVRSRLAMFRGQGENSASTRCRFMRTLTRRIVTLTAAVSVLPLMVVYAQTKDEAPASKPDTASKLDAAKIEPFKPEQQTSKGSVTVGGNLINYDAIAGTLVVHPKDWDDVPQNQNKDKDDKS